MMLAGDPAQGGHCPASRTGARLGHRRTEAVLEKDRVWDDLMRRANGGDGAAFLRFLTEVTPPLRGLIRTRGRSLPPDLHEDILQEVLLAIHLKRGS